MCYNVHGGAVREGGFCIAHYQDAGASRRGERTVVAGVGPGARAWLRIGVSKSKSSFNGLEGILFFL